MLSTRVPHRASAPESCSPTSAPSPTLAAHVNQATDDFYFATDQMRKLGATHHEVYLQAQPFPHIVIDDLLPGNVIRSIVDAFPEPGGQFWQKYDADREVKLALAAQDRVPVPIRHILQQFNSAPFMNFLETLSGISGLIPDPHFFGGGLHQIVPGGFLKVHADFNKHNRLKLDRRLNALLYLNEDWNEDWGGHLELWDREMSAAQARIAPVANRLVVFATTDFSHHGHPDPLRSPPGVTRKSLAFYYYTNGRPGHEISSEGDHTTLFRARPGEDIGRDKNRLKDIARRSVPPILADAIRKRRAYTD